MRILPEQGYSRYLETLKSPLYQARRRKAQLEIFTGPGFDPLRSRAIDAIIQRIETLKAQGEARPA